MKNLALLDISFDDIGELGILEMMNELNLQGAPSLEVLDLSGNCIGKS